MAPPTVSDVEAVQGTFDELGRPLARCHVLRRRPRDDRRFGRQGFEDHRVRCGQGPRRRGARRVPDPGQSRRGHPGVHHRADRHHRPDGDRAPRGSPRCCPASWSSPAARCWSRTTRRSTSASSSTTARELGIAWPGFETLDTAVLARRVLIREEVPNCKLSTLAARFGAATTPNHRALSDARATVDVLHALFERLGSLGVTTLEEVATYTSKVKPEQRAQAPSRRAPARGAGRLPVPRRATTTSSTSARPATCAAAPSPTSPRPRRAPGWARWSCWPSASRASSAPPPLEAQVRELRLIARAPSAVQPAVAVPRQADLAQAHPRAVAAAVDRPHGPRRRRRLHRPVPRPRRRRERHGHPARLRSASVSARPGCRWCRAPRPCALAEMGHCLSPCDGSADADELRR